MQACVAKWGEEEQGSTENMDRNYLKYKVGIMEFITFQ